MVDKNQKKIKLWKILKINLIVILDKGMKRFLNLHSRVLKEKIKNICSHFLILWRRKAKAR